jgi:hypothetical protein
MRRHRGSRGGKEPGHDRARLPGRGIEARTDLKAVRRYGQPIRFGADRRRQSRSRITACIALGSALA